MSKKEFWFRACGWRIEKREDGEWRNIFCTLEAEVSEPRVNIRRKYSLGWNGKRFAQGSELEVMSKKNPRLLKSIKKALEEK